MRAKIQSLCSRIAELNLIFGSPINDVAEQMRRNVLLRYVVYPALSPGAEFLPVGSRILKHNCGLCSRSQGRGDLLTMSKTAKRFPGSSKIYKKLSPTTRLVHDLAVVLGVNQDSRWSNKWRSTSKGAS